jgi:hypothetical protein
MGGVGHRVNPWQGKLLLAVVCLELTNACLSSIPSFAMWSSLEASSFEKGRGTKGSIIWSSGLRVQT